MRIVLVCCVILTITVSASCIERAIRPQYLTDIRCKKKLINRDASILVDTSPIEIDQGLKVHPVIAFRRLSRSRQTPRPLQSSRLHKSTKKFRKPSKPKHTPTNPYRKRVKSKKYLRKRVVPKSKNYPPKYLPHYSPYDSFGEPPSDLKSYSKNEYDPLPKHNYGDEIVDSYGKPIKPGSIDIYPPIQPTQYYKELTPRPGLHSWQDYNQHKEENSYIYSKKPKPESYDIQDIDEEDDFKMDNSFYYYWLQEKPTFNMEQSKMVRVPWKVTGGKRIRDDDALLVGGQYAEPPARYVPKFQPSAPMFDNEDEFSPRRKVLRPEVPPATVSPYVNYKHSNMAFSPQNLNDAFSI